MTVRFPLPKNVSIRMRRMGFTLSEQTPEDWYANSPFLTSFFNAMSSLFPEGEKFFIDSVKHYEKDINDRTLRDQIREFCKQEGQHSFHHRVLNELIEKRGVRMSRYEHVAKRLLGLSRLFSSPLEQLAVTCALEHFTALMADYILKRPERTAGIHADVLPLWNWHAVEEAEHKGVCFDVYEAVGGDYLTRARMMAGVSTLFIPAIHRIQIEMLLRDPRPIDWRDVGRGLAYLYGKDGFLSGTVGAYFAYYKPKFHPWEQDNSALIEAWKRDNPTNVVARAA